jgi:RNA polymerase primary sigma factor
MNRKYVSFESNDNISKYFKDVRKSVVLTPNEEIEIAKRIKNGDEKAVELLVMANLKFVVSIAKEYQGQGLPLSDLINEGNYGLIKAVHKFDHKKGFKFISYAVWWIKQSILQSLNDNSRVVRLPANIINKITKLNKEIGRFEADNDREPTYEELSDNSTLEILGFPRMDSLNRPINEEGDELIEMIPGEFIDLDALEISQKLKEELNKILDVLDERERDIIESYFGINTDFEAMTLEFIGEKYDLTKERIRQIKNKAIRKLRHNSSGLQMLMNE